MKRVAPDSVHDISGAETKGGLERDSEQRESFAGNI